MAKICRQSILAKIIVKLPMMQILQLINKFLIVAFILISPLGARAAETANTISLQIPIFDYAESQNIAEYIGKIYQYLMIVLVPLAIIVIIISGILWISAAGDSGKITQAKSRIISAFTGLGIALFSYVILSLIGITELKLPSIDTIAEMRGIALNIESDISTGSSDICIGLKTYASDTECKAQETKCSDKSCMKNPGGQYCCVDKPAKAIYVHWSAGMTTTNTPAYTFTVTGDGVVHQNYSELNGSECTRSRNQKGNMCVSGMGAFNFTPECYKKSSVRGENCNPKGTFTEKQIAAMIAKIGELKTKFNIPSLTHSQAAIQDNYHCYLTPKNIANYGSHGCRWDWNPNDAMFN